MDNNQESFEFNIERFIGHFEKQVQIIDKLSFSLIEEDEDEKLYIQKEILLVSLIDSLSNIRFNKINFPQLAKKNRERFVRFVKEYSEWKDGNLVSIVFLRDNFSKEFKNNPLFKYIDEKVKNYTQLDQWKAVNEIDEEVTELKLLAVNEKEEEAIEYYQHYSILYRYRNYLIHEARKPGYGMEFMSYEKDFAIYHSYINDETLHLLYPIGLIKRITCDSISNIKTYFKEQNINPYAFVNDTLRF